MSSLERFRPLTLESAPVAARPLLAATEKQFGFVPEPVARAAHSPALLAHLLAGFAAFDRSSLEPIEREVVALGVAFENGCHYCMALHSAVLASDPDHARVLAALRDGSPLPSPRLEALRELVRALIEQRGRAPEERWQAFFAAGFRQEQALDVLLGVGVYVLSTLTNVVTDAQLDPPFLPFAWQDPRSR